VRGPRAVPTNLAELAKIVSPVIASAPQTCFDPANDGRWLTPSLQILAYLGRIDNQSVRDAMALFAILRADRQQFSMHNQISNFAYIMRRVMTEQSIEDVTSIDANDLLFRIHVSSMFRHGPLRYSNLAHLDIDILPHLAGIRFGRPGGSEAWRHP